MLINYINAHVFCFNFFFISDSVQLNVILIFGKKKKELNSGQSKYTIICTICKNSNDIESLQTKLKMV